ncbi:MAG: transcriptional regulator [Kiritimatiellia bacterium]
MKTLRDHPFASLERLFHEPARLAIISALCESPEGRSFGDLKTECRLTDGNLNRHLKMLSDGGITAVTRITGEGRPQTLIRITPVGREGFLHYLSALEEVLHKAASALDHSSAAPSAQLPSPVQA